MARYDVFSNCAWLIRRPQVLAIVAIAIGSPLALPADVDSKLLQKALSRAPKQSDAVYDQVPEADAASCTGIYETRNKVDGMLISSPNGQPLRWFADTNGDKKIDFFSYYRDGIESYREIDSDYDEKVDQFRWLGMAGMRWGVDRDQDGKIDTWKAISAEEVSFEVVEALRTSDADRFQRLLITADDIKSTGLGPTKTNELGERAATSMASIETVFKTSKVDRESRWASFGADKPGVVPAGTEGSTKDVVAYENAIAVIETKDGPQQVMVGTLVRVGDTWKLIDAPRLAGDDRVTTDSGMFFAVGSASNSSAPDGRTVALAAPMEKLIREMEGLETKLSTAAEAEKSKLHAQKADIVQMLIEASSTSEDAQAWTRQLADQLLAAVQSGEYPDGVARLRKLRSSIVALDNAKSEEPYVAYRIVTAEYNLALAGPNVNYEAVQKAHLEKLEAFVESFPESLDAADAMIQLGYNFEITDDLKKAENWYRRAATSFPKTPEGEKASGAILRMELEKKQIAFEGTTLNGKTFSTANLKRPVIVHYWASYCEPCKADMQEFQKLEAKYAKAGLTIVGINTDSNPADALKFLKDNKNVGWVQLHEKGGLNSRLAVGLGVFSLPVTIIIDKTGTVVKSTSHYTPAMELEIQGLLK